MEERLTSCGNLLTSSSDTNDDALTPTLVAGLERAAHDVDVTSAVKGVVTATVRHLNQLLLDRLTLEVSGVDKVSRAKLGTPLLFLVVDVDDNDLLGAVLDSSLDDGQTDTASAKDSDVGALLDTALAGGNDGRAISGGDTATEQAGAVHRGLVSNGDDGDVGHDGVLGESRSSHEVEEVFALALEARGSVWHDTLALGRTNLAAEVGLSRLAELALFTLWGAVQGQPGDVIV